MGQSDSDDDIRQYLPDLDSIRREADPARAEQKHRKALDNPELDQVIAEIKASESQPFPFPSVPVAPKVPAAAGPSRWASEALPPIDKAALPSSLAPSAVPPVTSPIPPGVEGAPAGARRRWRGWVVGVLAALTVLAPVVLMTMLQETTVVVPGRSRDVPSAVVGPEAAATREAPASAAPPIPEASAAPRASAAPPIPEVSAEPARPVRAAPNAPSTLPSDELMQ